MQLLTTGAAKLSLTLSESQLRQFQTYFELLTEWNQRVNLTSITTYEDVQVKHFLDSLTAVQALPEEARLTGAGLRAIDVGAGGGFPGIPLKIILPQLGLVLLEATGKKTAFLEELVRALALPDVAVVNARAEDLARDAAYREQFDVVMARALAEMAALAELTLPFCRIGGIVIAHKKGDITAELQASRQAISLMGGRLLDVTTINLEELGPDRVLVVLEKIILTPDKYPRRSGMPEKKPIK